MAAPANGNGRNGRDRLEGTVAGQKFAVSARDLLSILLLIGTFVLGWVVWKQVSLGLRLLHGQHREIERMLDEQNALLHAQTKEMVHLLFALDYNIGRPPEQRIPLRLYVTEQERKHEGLTPEQREEKVRQEIEAADKIYGPRK